MFLCCSSTASSQNGQIIDGTYAKAMQKGRKKTTSKKQIDRQRFCIEFLDTPLCAILNLCSIEVQLILLHILSCYSCYVTLLVLIQVVVRYRYIMHYTNTKAFCCQVPLHHTLYIFFTSYNIQLLFFCCQVPLHHKLYNYKDFLGIVTSYTIQLQRFFLLLVPLYHTLYNYMFFNTTTFVFDWYRQIIHYTTTKQIVVRYRYIIHYTTTFSFVVRYRYIIHYTTAKNFQVPLHHTLHNYIFYFQVPLHHTLYSYIFFM